MRKTLTDGEIMAHLFTRYNQSEADRMYHLVHKNNEKFYSAQDFLLWCGTKSVYTRWGKCMANHVEVPT